MNMTPRDKYHQKRQTKTEVAAIVSDPFIGKIIKATVAFATIILIAPGIFVFVIIIVTDSFRDFGVDTKSYQLIRTYFIPLQIPSGVFEIIKASIASIPFFLIRSCFKPHKKSEPLMLNGLGKTLIVVFFASGLLSVISLVFLPEDITNDLPHGYDYEILRKSCEITFTYSMVYAATLCGFKRESIQENSA